MGRAWTVPASSRARVIAAAVERKNRVMRISSPTSTRKGRHGRAGDRHWREWHEGRKVSRAALKAAFGETDTVPSRNNALGGLPGNAGVPPALSDIRTVQELLRACAEPGRQGCRVRSTPFCDGEAPLHLRPRSLPRDVGYKSLALLRIRSGPRSSGSIHIGPWLNT